jgi:hypothetical protein
MNSTGYAQATRVSMQGLWKRAKESETGIHGRPVRPFDSFEFSNSETSPAAPSLWTTAQAALAATPSIDRGCS